VPGTASGNLRTPRSSYEATPTDTPTATNTSGPSVYLPLIQKNIPAPGVWSITGSLNVARFNHTATLLPNGKVLVAGGAGNSAELYDPATGVWTYTGGMHYARSGHTATLLLNGQVLVAGGAGNSAELYDPATGRWTVTGSLNTARIYHTATLLGNGSVLVAGGEDDSGFTLASAELYTGPLPALGQRLYLPVILK